MISIQLTTKHLDLLNEMYLLAQKVIEIKGGPLDEFKIGYHAEPSMQQVHLHVVSTDFNSPALKNKKHWNSFTTDFFVNHEGKTGLYSENYTNYIHVTTHVHSHMKFALCLISYLTKLFEIPDLVKRLKADGKVAKLNPTVVKELLATPLKCHRCHEMPKTMPALKTHLLQHLK